MRIFIITMDDPVYTIPFIKQIIEQRKKDVIGLAVSKGDRLTIGKKRSGIVYLFSLLLIMGIVSFSKYAFTTLFFKIQKFLASRFSFIPSPSLFAFAEKNGIPAYKINSPNSESFLTELKKLRPDVIINQSQSIIRKELLQIPTIGVINRHNALLPKNRGRLTPFWVLFRKETQTGVTIHFVDEGIDSGDIIVQEQFEVAPNETFASLVRKNYKVAAIAIDKALHHLENNNFIRIPNDDSKASYNTVPTFMEAFTYRMKRWGLK